MTCVIWYKCDMCGEKILNEENVTNFFFGKDNPVDMHFCEDCAVIVWDRISKLFPKNMEAGRLGND